MIEKKLSVDPAKCTGCGWCVRICSIREKNICDPAVSRIQVFPIDGGSRFLPVICRHCEDAPCLAACPKKAIFRDESLHRVLVQKAKCVGCGMCVFACPFGAIHLDAFSRRSDKCDLCDGDPMCVKFCREKALRYENVSMESYDRMRSSSKIRVPGRR